MPLARKLGVSDHGNNVLLAATPATPAERACAGRVGRYLSRATDHGHLQRVGRRKEVAGSGEEVWSNMSPAHRS